MRKYIFTIFASTLIFISTAVANDVMDYLTPNYQNNLRNFGDPTKGSAYDMGKEWVKSAFDYDEGYVPTPGDKINEITVFKGGDRIKGIRIGYLYAEDETMGAVDGTNYRTETLDPDEYVKSIKIFTKDSGRLARLYLWTQNGRQMAWGSNNGYKHKMENVYSFPNDQVLVGFWGTVDYDEIWSLNLITTRLIELEYVGITWHEDHISNSSQEMVTYSSNIGINDTNLVQSKQMRLGITQGYSVSDSYSTTAGITVGMSVTVGSEAKAGILTLKESATWSSTASLSTTVGSSSTDNQSYINTMVETIAVNPYTIAAMKGINTIYTADFPYTITYQNPYDGAQFEVNGVVNDVSFSEGESFWSNIGTVNPDSGLLNIDTEWLENFGHYDGTYAQDYF